MQFKIIDTKEPVQAKTRVPTNEELLKALGGIPRGKEVQISEKEIDLRTVRVHVQRAMRGNEKLKLVTRYVKAKGLIRVCSI